MDAPWRAVPCYSVFVTVHTVCCAVCLGAVLGIVCCSRIFVASEVCSWQMPRTSVLFRPASFYKSSVGKSLLQDAIEKSNFQTANQVLVTFDSNFQTAKQCKHFDSNVTCPRSHRHFQCVLSPTLFPFAVLQGFRRG